MILRWLARIAAAVLVLSLGFGWIVRAVDSGKLVGWGGWLQPVYNAEAVDAGYTYYESRSRIGRAGMVRRRTGDEPIAWDAATNRPQTIENFYGQRVRATLDHRLHTAIAMGAETATMQLVGWPWKVWVREFRAGTQASGIARTSGFVSWGPFGVMTRPVWPGFPLAVVVVTVAIWGMEQAGCCAVRKVRRMRTPHGHCTSCGYDLTGIDAALCPECGHATEWRANPAGGPR